MSRNKVFFVMVFVLMALNSFAVNAMSKPSKDKRGYIQLTIYHFKNKQQEVSIDSFLQHRLLPFLHSGGNSKVGVFKPIANDTATDKRVYVLLPFASLKQWEKYVDEMDKMSTLDYTNPLYNTPAFERVETIFLKAFEEMPTVEPNKLTSPKSERVYELRSYESKTEPIYKNKVKMFNAGGEVKLFSRLGFNAIFYGEVLYGSKMPNLMYMTSFENMKARDEHWKAFGADPEWKKLSAEQQYQNNVSHIDITFLRSADYSDL